MATITYGTRVKNTMMGGYGVAVECPNCHKTYKQAYIKQTKYAHISYIPVCPLPTRYYITCPVCGKADLVDPKVAKAEIAATAPVFEVKPVLVKNGKNVDVFIEDIKTGEKFLIFENYAKWAAKDRLKSMGYKVKEVEVREA